MRIRKTILPFLIFVVFVFSNCANDSEQDLLKDIASCDTIGVSYSSQIVPLMQNNCLGCHSTGIEEGGVILDSYSAVKSYAESGLLIGVITHDLGSPMPKDQDKLSDCDIAKIRAWISDGTLDN